MALHTPTVMKDHERTTVRRSGSEILYLNALAALSMSQENERLCHEHELLLNKA